MIDVRKMFDVHSVSINQHDRFPKRGKQRGMCWHFDVFTMVRDGSEHNNAEGFAPDKDRHRVKILGNKCMQDKIKRIFQYITIIDRNNCL